MPLIKKIDRIAIVGVGLIGGSIGLAVKKRKLANFVSGVVRRKSSAVEALSSGCVDMATLDLAKGVVNADLVILASPVSAITAQMKSLSAHLKPGAIVIDVGSSKKMIDEMARRQLKNRVFVGCHPMAGSEKQGAFNADAELFQGAICFLTASHPRVEAFWKALGAKPVHLKADLHDRWVAAASHLPHALAFSLMSSISGELNRAPIASQDINPSLRGLARLAKSDPALWADIFISNKKEIVRSVTLFEKNLRTLSKHISSGNKKAVVRFLQGGSLAARKIQ